MIAHSIVTVSFGLGVVDCSCGATISEPDDPVGDRDAGLASAYSEHRREAGAGRFHGELGYDRAAPGRGPKFSLESAAIRKARLG